MGETPMDTVEAGPRTDRPRRSRLGTVIAALVVALVVLGGIAASLTLGHSTEVVAASPVPVTTGSPGPRVVGELQVRPVLAVGAGAATDPAAGATTGTAVGIGTAHVTPGGGWLQPERFRPTRLANASDLAWITEADRGQFQALACPSTPVPAPPGPQADLPVLSCSRDGGEKFILGPTELSRDDIASATVVTDPAGMRKISVTMTPQGAKTLAAVTQRLAGYGKGAPRSRMAVVVGGVTFSAPQVDEPITGGELQITGLFSPAEAEELAAALSHRS